MPPQFTSHRGLIRYDNSFMFKPELSDLKELYETALEHKRNIEEYDEFFNWQTKYDLEHKNGIRGSSPYLAIAFERNALQQEGVRLPTPDEANILHELESLNYGANRDYGIVVQSTEGANKKLATHLAQQASRRGHELPLVIALSDLGNEQDLTLLSDPKHLLSGEEAAIYISQLNKHAYGDTPESTFTQPTDGARRLVNTYEQKWGLWDDLVSSGGLGQIDWLASESQELYDKLR